MKSLNSKDIRLKKIYQKAFKILDNLPDQLDDSYIFLPAFPVSSIDIEFTVGDLTEEDENAAQD